jgi:putative spermidine/putrescine transport system permease protein
MSDLAATSPFRSSRELKARLHRVERRHRLVSLGLAAPLVLFLIVFFVLPILQMLAAAWYDRAIIDTMPRTAAAMQEWDGTGLPGEPVYEAIARDLVEAHADRTLAVVARRMNQELPGARSLFIRLPGQLPDETPASWRDAMLEIDDRWGDRAHLVTLQRAARPLTGFYMLSALDMERNVDGSIAMQPPGQRLYLQLIGRTLNIAFSVTAICLVMGFPIALLLAHTGGMVRNVLLILVLLPFWTSLLVRTAAWIVVLQNEGVVNTALVSLGLLDEPVRMIYNRTGVLIVMSQVLLPFMILPLYAVMSGISQSHMRAALSLGGRPWFAFRRVYLPQTLPGVAAGTLLVFMLSIGYYITPALVGGSDDQMLSYFIAFYANQTINWGLAAALGTVLMAIVLVLFAIYSRVFGVDRIKVN